MTLLGRNLLTIFDLSSSEVMYLLDLAVRLKQMKKQGEVTDCLKGRNVALIFEKTSTRTRCAFEIAVSDLGGNAMYLGPGDTAVQESFKDSARVFGRMFDAIEYRGFDHSRIETLARYSGIPVWNGRRTSITYSVSSRPDDYQGALQKTIGAGKHCLSG